VQSHDAASEVRPLVHAVHYLALTQTLALGASPGRDIHLTADVLDRIDDIVTPGTLINPADSSYANPALEPSARRRT